MSLKKPFEIVSTPNFPAYAITAVSGRYVIVGGGGGAARTGIKNKFDVYELYHNGEQTSAERVVSHDVGSACISNLAAWCEVENSSSPNEKLSPCIYLALGQEEKCVLLKLNPKFDSALPLDDLSLDDSEDEETQKLDDSESNPGPASYQKLIAGFCTQSGLNKTFWIDKLAQVYDLTLLNWNSTSFNDPDFIYCHVKAEENTARNRIQDINTQKLREMMAKKRKQERIRRESINSTLRGEKYLTFDIEEMVEKETVFRRKNDPMEDVYQKVVRVSLDSKLLATGGTDGHFRIWSLPSMNLLKEVEAHTKEVDDLDFTPDGKQLVSLCKPTRECCVWSVAEGKKLVQLELPTNGIKYKFYRARFAPVEGKQGDMRLFTISNAVVGSKRSGIVAKWHSKTFALEKEREVKGTLSSLALSDNGRYLAAGTMEGTVYLIISFSLQILTKVEDAHSVFVTGLSWLPTENPESKMVRGYSDASVLSISCDNTLKIFNIPRQQMMPIWCVALIAVVVLFTTFSLASYFGL